ncbi:MAG: thiamine-phosphate kinase [Nitrospirae bacterium]|nr:thiamine-phosphate kinase [Nitrospirota bacterium]
MKDKTQLRADGELALVADIRRRFTKMLPELPEELILGIGDDAAVLRIGGRDVLFTTDVMVEGVHFDMAFATPFQVGHKLVTVNVSDIYAMAGRPAYMLLTMSIPAHRATVSSDLPATVRSDLINMSGAGGSGFVDEFLDGVADALSLYNVELIGGDVTSSQGGISVSATVIGFADAPVLRKGAAPGDRLYVTGNLGDSACGLHLLQRINRPVVIERQETINSPLPWQVMGPLLHRHLMPVVSAPVTGVRPNAMMDVSDGLSIDLRRLCTESGVGARVYETSLPRSVEMIEAATFLGIDPTMLSLCGGEDYQYLFTSPEPVSGSWCIGEITDGGLFFIDSDNKQRELVRCGYEHFTSDCKEWDRSIPSKCKERKQNQ